MSDFSVEPVDRLEVCHSSWEWPFAHARRREIKAHFAQLQSGKPELFNGRVLMLRDFAIVNRVFSGRTFETDYASLLAWRDWDFPDPTVKNVFAMGALRSADGAFLLGEMGPQTANAGKIYFPAGTPEPDDVADGKVDLLGSVTREVEEETGLSSVDYKPEPGWCTVVAGPRIALMKLLQATASAKELHRRIDDFLAKQRRPEFSGIHIVHGPADLNESMQPFVIAFLRHLWDATKARL